MRQVGQQSLLTLLSSSRPRYFRDISLDDFLEKKTKNPTTPGCRNCTGDAPTKRPDMGSPTANATSSCRENVLDSLRAQRTSLKKQVGNDLRRKKRRKHDAVAREPHLLVLGDEPRRLPKPVRVESSIPIFNHYADGNGWWEGDMVGLDPAVATCEWEGVGTMSFGDSSL